MKKKLLALMILLLLAMSLGISARPVAAEGIRQVDFTAISTSDCSPAPSWCSYGETSTLPNGKFIVSGWKAINVFTATDPRWNADCYFSGDPFPPGGGAFPVSGAFTCYPRDSRYTGGWWVGRINMVYQADKVLAVWHAKGYGTLAHLEVIVHQINPHWFSNVPSGTTDVGVIIELPGY